MTFVCQAQTEPCDPVFSVICSAAWLIAVPPETPGRLFSNKMRPHLRENKKGPPKERALVQILLRYQMTSDRTKERIIPMISWNAAIFIWPLNSGLTSFSSEHIASPKEPLPENGKHPVELQPTAIAM